MAQIEDLVVYHSGEAGNSNGQEDTGGGIGERFQSMNWSLNSASISGLSIVDIFGFDNNELLTITFDDVAETVTITDNDSSFNETYTLSGVDEVVTIKNINGIFIILDITYALITQSSNKVAEYILNDIRQNLFDNVLPLESTNGYTDYRVIYIYNEGGTDALNVKLYTLQPTGEDVISIAYGSVNTLITDTGNIETDPLNNANAYTITSSLSNAVYFGTIPAGQYLPIILKREVPQGVGSFSSNTLDIVIAAD